MPFIKTKLGEHDYHKPACAEFCKMGGEHCPFVNAGRTMVTGIVRWTDIADWRVLSAFDANTNEDKPGYNADFSEKTESMRRIPEGENLSLSDHNLAEEFYAAGYTCWGDGSGFEYDRMSRNVMGPGGPAESVYDITDYGISHEALQFSRWNAWIDKFQYDYRFGRVSDTNAECILFPNVDNPWMFTEYVFKGIGDDKGKCALDIPSEYVVEPPLYDPKTLHIKNCDIFLESPDDYDGKYSGECNDNTVFADSDGSGGQGGQEQVKLVYGVKQKRVTTDWHSLTTWTIYDTGGDSELNMAMNFGTTPLDARYSGMKLYRARIPVQCVKWGEHGNIPPHTLDMTAPKSWFDPSNMVTKMKAVYDAVIGTAIESPYDGKIEWGNAVDENGSDIPGQQGRQPYVYVGMDLAMGVDGHGNRYYAYTGGSRTAVSAPEEMKNGVSKLLKPAVKLMPDRTGEEYCHGGCALLSGRSGSGRLVCKCIEGAASEEDRVYYNNHFAIGRCLNRGFYLTEEGQEPCKGYVASRNHPQIATYQDEILSVDQISLEGASQTVTMMGMEMDKIAKYYANLGKRKDIDITYVVRYEPVMGSDAEAQLNKKKYNEFGKGVQIVPGTGRYAIDSEKDANPFSGGDTNAYGDINTISFHRFFASVMHCANHKYCNMITGKQHEQGFSFDKRAGGDDDCRYHKDYANGVEGCPYNCAPKRAVEFAYCSSGISTLLGQYRTLYNVAAEYFIWDFNPGEYRPETSNMYTKQDSGNGEFKWCILGSYAVCQMTDFVALLAVSMENSGVTPSGSNIDYSPEWCGAALLAGVPGSSGVSLPEGFMLIGEFSTQMEVQKVLVPDGVESQFDDSESETGDDDDDDDEDDGYHLVKARLYHAVDSFYWFQPLDNNGSPLAYNEYAPPNLRQHVDENGYWFCRSELFPIPSGNCVMLDNEEKFIGGWHPEYKDYSKIGSEFMQDIVTEDSREGQGKGDYVQNGDYTPIPLSTTKQGYWIDQSGEYIVTEDSIGADELIATDGAREEVGGGGDGVKCISFKKSNTSINMETGKRSEPKTTNGAVYSNDPYDLVVTQFKAARGKNEFGERTGRPTFKDPDTGEDYLAPLIMNNPYMLPTMRHALHCKYCDYYISYKYSTGLAEEETKCPWCGSVYEVITGDAGIGMEAGRRWSENASIIRKFFKIYAIGNADVWAPPGTAIKTDAYFWRHQAQITNANRKQILHRLGDSNKDGKGGAYKFNKMSPTSEMTLGYPEGIGKFIKVPKGAETDTTSFMRYSKSYIDWTPDEDACVDGMWNPVMPRHMMPEWYGKQDAGAEDEGVIAPYTNSGNDALKMASHEQMRIFRNGIEPIYAYCLSEYSYSGDYPTLRASYDQRESVDQPIIWQGRKATISPQVLACTSDGRDSYQTYFSGDLVYGNVREYFPSGYTWWMMKNTLGGRCTLNEGGGYHMDDGGKQLGGRMVGGSGGEYTCGTRTVAKCALSIHGVIPLDKEILKAYIVISPSGLDPSKNPIGRSWTGGPVMYCHYHALPKEHYHDGQERHLHGTAGYPPGQYFDDDGNFINENPGVQYMAGDIAYQDDSAYRLWGRESHLIDDDRWLYYDVDVRGTMTNIPCLYDTTFHRRVGTSKVPVLKYGSETEVLGMGYDAWCFGDPAGFTTYNLSNTPFKRQQKFQYLVVDPDGMLSIKYPESVVWKTDSGDQIEKTIGNHMATIELKVSDGTVENTKSYQFRQADSDLYQNQMPRQSQEITGYFDMSWANTKGYVYDEYAVERKTGGGKWDAPVVFQDNSLTFLSVKYNGGGNSARQIGQVARCMDVTEIVKSLYNKRIDRMFYAEAGCTFGDILKWKFYPTLKSDGLSSLDKDVELENSMLDVQPDGSYLLTDTDTYPELEGDVSDIPLIDPDGEKYKLAKKTAKLTIQLLFPLVITDYNNGYSITVGEGTVTDSISTGVYRNMAEIIDEITGMFPGAKVEPVSANSVLVSADEKKIEIHRYPHSCYETFGIYLHDSVDTATIRPRQDRTYGTTNSKPGFSPDGLFGEGTGRWVYDTYDESPQSFVVDLLRAPLCMMQRNWRYEEGDEENPGDGIMTYIYDAPFSPDPFITKIVISPRREPNTSYRVFAKPDGFSSWRNVLNVVYRKIQPPDQSGNNGGQNQMFQSGYELVFPLSERNMDAQVDKETGRATVTISGHALRARHLKVECDSEMLDFLHCYPITGVQGSPYQIMASGEFSTMGMVGLQGTIAVILDQPSENPFSESSDSGICEIVASQIVGEGSSKMRIALNKPVYDVDGKYIHFYALRQMGGIETLRVYGAHYKTEEHGDAENSPGSGKKYLSITDMEDEYRWILGTQTTKYNLPEPPTQIFDVSVGTDGTAGVSLEEARNSGTPLEWKTVVEKFTIKVNDPSTGRLVPREYFYRRIVGGNYYYDIYKGVIRLPRKDQDGVPWNEFEAQVKEVNSFRSYMPNAMVMRYWSGNGKSITFKAKANGNGPSYMVEKNAIQEIVETTSLPDNGTSCKMMDLDGREVRNQPIPWICYNNIPSTLSIEDQSTAGVVGGIDNRNAGEFRKPSFTGKEICDQMENDNAFVELFGEHCEACRGQCETEVTLTGAPNQIISGRLEFLAKAVTKRAVYVGGKTVYYKERTGGLDNGIIIVSCAPISPGGGRMTLCYGIPELLIYAKEATMFTEYEQNDEV